MSVLVHLSLVNGMQDRRHLSRMTIRFFPLSHMTTAHMVHQILDDVNVTRGWGDGGCHHIPKMSDLGVKLVVLDRKTTSRLTSRASWHTNLLSLSESMSIWLLQLEGNPPRDVSRTVLTCCFLPQPDRLRQQAGVHNLAFSCPRTFSLPS